MNKYSEDNQLMQDIVEKLQQLVYGKDKTEGEGCVKEEKKHSDGYRSTQRSNRKLIPSNSQKSRMTESSKNFYSEMPVYDYNDNQGRNQSTMHTSKGLKKNSSMNPSEFMNCNKSQITSVKVYKLNVTDRDKDLHQSLKTCRKSQKISSKIFK